MDGVTNAYESMDAFKATIPYGAHWLELEETRFKDFGSDLEGHDVYWESHYKRSEHRLLCADPTCEPCTKRGRIENIVDIISGRGKNTNYRLGNSCYKCNLPHVYWLHGSYDNGIWRTEHFEEEFFEHFKGQEDTTCWENEKVLLAMEKLVRKCGVCDARGKEVYFIRRNTGSEEYGMNPRDGIEDQGIGYRTSLLEEHQRWHDGEEDKRYTDKEIEHFFPLSKSKLAPTYKTDSDWFDELKGFHESNPKSSW